MLYYEEKVIKGYDEQPFRRVCVYDGGSLVGQFTERKSRDGAISYDAEAWSNDHGEMMYVSRNLPNVAACKKALREHGYDTPTENCTNAAYLPAGDGEDFYPTPSKLAGKMLGKVDWKNVSAVLEPSAGKGDLIDAMSRCSVTTLYGRRYGNDRMRELAKNTDVIETDYNLRLMLRGKGLHLIHDDFLTFRTHKHYDLILMNPPFSNGDEHLLKAIELQQHGGGQIVCLLNAETIRNPYTNRRKALLDILADYGASIEFVQDAFKHAQRPTDVEVAVVYLNIPRPASRSHILEHMKKAQETASEAVEPEALVYGNEIEQMLQSYNLEADCGTALIEEWNALSPYISDKGNNPILTLRVDGAVGCDVNDYLKKLRYKYWSKILDVPAIRNKLTSAMADDYHSKLWEMQDYDFTEHNIMQLFYDINLQLVSGVEDSINELFDTLSAKHAWYPECQKNIHYYNGWKTNQAHKVGMKAILPINGYGSYSWEKDKIDEYDVWRKISDLEKALSFLDKGEVCFREDPKLSIERANAAGKNCAEFTYFDAVFYKKGTCHIKFHSEAAPLIDRLNIFAARKRAWLPPTYGRVKYEDMTAEEQSVIDDFSGRENYAKVMDNPKNWIIDGSSVLALGA